MINAELQTHIQDDVVNWKEFILSHVVIDIDAAYECVMAALECVLALLTIRMAGVQTFTVKKLIKPQPKSILENFISEIKASVL